MRYANPDILFDSPIKLNSRDKYNALESEVTSFLQDLSVTLYSVVIDKEAYWDKYPSQNPYIVAYVFLLERFQMFLKEKNALGISIIDPREGQVEKHYIGNELSTIHEKLRWYDGNIWKKCDRVVEKLLFSESKTTTGIQLSDLYCYPIFHLFEYNKEPSKYWRYEEITKTKLYKYKNNLIGYGLKVFPDKTKKDLGSFDT